MHPSEDKIRLRAEEEREKLAIRGRERAMQDEQRELEHAMEAFEEDADQAKRYIEAELRQEHFGHDPSRPPAWARDRPNSSSRPRRPRSGGSAAGEPADGRPDRRPDGGSRAD